MSKFKDKCHSASKQFLAFFGVGDYKWEPSEEDLAETAGYHDGLNRLPSRAHDYENPRHELAYEVGFNKGIRDDCEDEGDEDEELLDSDDEEFDPPVPKLVLNQWVVVRPTVQEVLDVAREAYDEGWRPLGGVVMHDARNFMQTLTRHEVKN